MLGHEKIAKRVISIYICNTPQINSDYMQHFSNMSTMHMNWVADDSLEYLHSFFYVVHEIYILLYCMNF